MPGVRCPSKTPAMLLAKSLALSRGGAAAEGAQEDDMLFVAVSAPVQWVLVLRRLSSRAIGCNLT